MSFDLRQLAVTRSEAEPPRKAQLSRFVLPGLLLAGFAGLVAYALRDSLSPPRPVTITASVSATSAIAGCTSAATQTAPKRPARIKIFPQV